MSDRKKQIEEAAEFGEMIGNQPPFIRGAEWADANPPAPSEDDEPRCAECGHVNCHHSDERDAEIARKKCGYKKETDFHDPYLPTAIVERKKCDAFKYGFVEGRKGMVPAAEVERLKSERDLAKMGWNQAKENHAAEVESWQTHCDGIVRDYELRIAEAVKQAKAEERERCAAAVYEELRGGLKGTKSKRVGTWMSSFAAGIRYLILNPPSGGKSDE